MAQIIWNKKENRPATGSEIKKLEEDEDLIFNYYSTDKNNTGLIWADLTVIGERVFELRELPNNACSGQEPV